ncbi:Wadjet anti-phage system protein JetD domain-containing protein [Embleya hyalina]|uniref:Wadjet protein JetD C-terminal domain-containing protein n=1 Tax=Embleya hyalina TaxID=516124 RepID=A0A401YYH1_9ACTN|nr:Wadjet anti-phage system protein JetD domain-containing protein [Embleya hyalina]GCD99641.1 hypothetical protein EHYA_07363 [Embleya hyalina]
MPQPRPWTTPRDLAAKLRARFDRGEFLTMLATGQPWHPLELPIRGPGPRELVDNFAAAQTWVRLWEDTAPPAMRVEYRNVGGRLLGTNRLPASVVIDDYSHLWDLLGVRGTVRRYTDLLSHTEEFAPRVAAWMIENPRHVLAHHDIWPTLITAVIWIERHARPGTHLRHLDIPGVDTKFVETHRGVLTDILDRHLPDERIDPGAPRSDFIGRYRFARKPEYVRIRRLGGPENLFGPFSEAAVRVDELATTALRVDTVYVVENEITYLAFPPVRDAIVVFGAGYAVTRLAPLGWLHDRSLLYWGDIDTHGFAILDRLRRTFPHTRSMLMDHATLLAHRTQWVVETRPIKEELPHLTKSETDVYRALTDDGLGTGVRLEQERIRFSTVEKAISQS